MAEKKDPFEEIAEEAIRKAEKVVCDLATFREGLRTLAIALQERYQLEPKE